MKRTLLTLLRRCGVFASFRYLNRSKVLILTYHRFSRLADGRSTPEAAFAEQLEHLQKHYYLLSLSTLETYLTSNKRLPENTAAITIDDGFYDAYEIAFPLLRERRVPATLFVITDFVDQNIWVWTDKLRYVFARVPVGRTRVAFDRYDLAFDLDGEASRLKAASKINSILKTLPESEKDAAIEEITTSLHIGFPMQPPAEFGPVTWDQVRDMDKAGVEIGSHTVTHPILTNVDDNQLRDELVNSKTRLESVLDRSVTLFCYPNGSYDGRVEAAVRGAGYRLAVTTNPCLNNQPANPHALGRVPAEPDLDHFEQSVSGLEQFKGRLRRPSAE